MNKKRKKYSALTRAFLLFSAVILALSFSACSGGTDEDAEKTPTAAAATPTPQEYLLCMTVQKSFVRKTEKS